MRQSMTMQVLTVHCASGLRVTFITKALAHGRSGRFDKELLGCRIEVPYQAGCSWWSSPNHGCLSALPTFVLGYR